MSPGKDNYCIPTEWYNIRTVSLYHSGYGSMSMAYRCCGTGQTVVFLHEFGCSSWSWEKLIRILSEDFTCIAPDLPGCGSSENGNGNLLTMVSMTRWTAKFIEQLNLRDVVLIGHGMGGEIALGLIGQPEIKMRIRSLALIACGAIEKEIPSYIVNIGHSSMTKPILNLIYSGFVVRMILKYAYAPHHTPDSGLCANYAVDLNRPGRIKTLIAAARAYARPAVLPAACDLPMVIISGDEDRILSYEAAERLHRCYPGSALSYLSGCGHIPQEECPAETAAILKAFISGKKDPDPAAMLPLQQHRKMRLSRLFDFWRPGTLVLMIILKILTFFRWLGVRVEQQSWRKISRFFLKREYSKFAIGQFRLRNGEHPSRMEAENFLEQRLHGFLIGQPDLHGLPGQSFFPRHRQEKFCDLLTAELDGRGRILRLTPHFDPRFVQPKLLVGKILETIVEVHNEYHHLSDLKRQEKIRRECRKRICHPVRFHPRRRLLILSLLERIMSGTFLFFDRLPPRTGSALEDIRFTPPDLKLFRHPGWGQTNIVCRLSADFREADLWWQFNHTMVDGAPMQEILSLLKKQWGSAGPLIFPPIGGLVSEPELMDCGDSLFRAHFFADFTPLLRLRSSLNRMCTPQMNGKASFAALLMWGLSRHPYFRNRKMLLPVDCRCPDNRRQLGLLITRPGRYDQGLSPLNDFCQFQTFVNLHLNEIRSGQAETSEMLTLFGMLHPFFYLLTQKLYPHALEEMLGTVGISIIADAEIFISPQTDIQINGFMSIGSALIQTGDGRRAGSVCVSGTREQIALYHEALTMLIRDMPHLLER